VIFNKFMFVGFALGSRSREQAGWAYPAAYEGSETDANESRIKTGPNKASAAI
jgi:hypothetical protein